MALLCVIICPYTKLHECISDNYSLVTGVRLLAGVPVLKVCFPQVTIKLSLARWLALQHIQACYCH